MGGGRRQHAVAGRAREHRRHPSRAGAGETVTGYLARAAVVPPGPPGPRPALVQFAVEQDLPGAAAAVAGTGATAREAVFRVPLPRVQTALRG
ncbi:hypothetical protein [Actinomycetospora sp. CA-053990]|uniref:hypothetical protein n=1 Tax=Actinomycetospora sp. CA-053990 TaxID=3239891 RepID=UPI003D901883